MSHVANHVAAWALDDMRKALTGISVITDVLRELTLATESEIPEIPVVAPMMEKLTCSRVTVGLLDAIDVLTDSASYRMARLEQNQSGVQQ